MDNIILLKEMMEEMPGGFFIYHADGEEELIYANQPLLRIFGCDTLEEFKELTGYTFKGIVHPDDLEMAEKSIREQIQHGRHSLDYLEYRIIRKDGSIRWVQDYGHLTHTEDYGDIFYVFIDDATERLRTRMRQLEEINHDLRKAYSKEKQYRTALLQNAVTFFEVNLSQNLFVTSAIQIQNGKQIDLFKYLGVEPFKTFTDYVAFWGKHKNLSNEEEYANFFNLDRLIRCCEKGEREQTFDAWVLDKLERKRMFRYTILLGCDEETGDVIGMFLARDLTDVAEVQSLLELALGQARAANIARSTFLSNMSHDIRTPLNGIVGYTNLIRENLEDTAKLNDYLDKIQLSSTQLLNIVDESLEYSRMESGRAVLSETEGNILDLLAATEKQILPMSNAKGITFIVDKTKIKHYSIIADFVRLKDVLCQLLDNAVKYTQPGGEIKFSVVEQRGISAGYVKYQFIVADNGIGISPEFIDKIFMPFEREHNTTDSGVIGSGLGLAVAKSLIDMMEGEIRVDSSPGKGSTFTTTILFRLAESYPDEQLENLSSLDEIELSGKRILVVEDNEINMEIILELLEMKGILTDRAENGLIAVEKVTEHLPGYYDLILMDIQMPVMGGYDATKKIRQLDDKKRSDIPIIALSANAFAEDIKNTLDAGMNAHISKPVDIGLLETVMKDVLLGQIPV